MWRFVLLLILAGGWLFPLGIARPQEPPAEARDDPGERVGADVPGVTVISVADVREGGSAGRLRLVNGMTLGFDSETKATNLANIDPTDRSTGIVWASTEPLVFQPAALLADARDFVVRLLAYSPPRTVTRARVVARLIDAANSATVLAEHIAPDMEFGEGLREYDIPLDFAGPFDAGTRWQIEIAPIGGAVNVQRVTARYRVAFPRFDWHDPSAGANGGARDMAITLIAPAPGQTVSPATGVRVAWECENLPTYARVCVEFRHRFSGGWQPAAMWIPHNFPTGSGTRGFIDWIALGEFSDLQFRIVYRTDTQIREFFDALESGAAYLVESTLRDMPDLANAIDATGRKARDVAKDLAPLLNRAGIANWPTGTVLARGTYQFPPAGFKWLRTEPFSCGGQTHTVAIYRCEIFAQALGLAHDATMPAVEFVWIPGGTFSMGSTPSDSGAEPDEMPAMTVNVSPFLIARTELTRGIWNAVHVLKKTNQGKQGWDESALPAHTVVLEEMESFLASADLRLPSEAEWEFACRASTTTRFSFGDSPENFNDFGWANARSTIHVATLEPNAFGLYDMHGNVCEACAGSFGPDLRDIPLDGSPRPIEAGNTKRPARGGAWTSGPMQCRSSERFGVDADTGYDYLGVRAAKSLP